VDLGLLKADFHSLDIHVHANETNKWAGTTEMTSNSVFSGVITPPNLTFTQSVFTHTRHGGLVLHHFYEA